MQALTVIRYCERVGRLWQFNKYKLLCLGRAMTRMAIGSMFVMMFFSCSSQDQLIPRALLFGNPEKAQPQISPNGKRIAYLAPRDGVLNIWQRTVKGGDDQPVTSEKGRGLSNYFWAPDSRGFLFLQDQNGNENTRLYFVDLETGAKRDLTPFEDVKVQVIASDKNIPDTLLIGMNRENKKVYDAYQLNLKTGQLDLAAKNDGTISQWIADSNLKVRGALIANSDAGYAVMVRDSEGATWTKFTEWGFEDSFGCNVIGFSKDGKSLNLIDSRESATGRLVRLDLASGKKEVIAEDPAYDVVNVMMHPDTDKIQMISWLKDQEEWIILDDSIRGDIEKITKIHGKNFSITNRDDADQNWVLRVVSDQAPAAYFLYHRETGMSDFLFEHQPELRKYKLATMKPISFQSRDGLTLHGYLTLPASSLLAQPAKPLPLILKVHGGPWNRDVWGYDSREQWLANRGYAVLQINFRGSTSYGKAFLNAANKEWGGKMQNDLTDAVEWAVQQGIADPKRVVIFGGSYGGYAALVGATFTPDLYKAAIAVVGPSNLISFLKTTPDYWSTELTNIKRRVGDPEKEIEFLKSRSPLFKVDQIRIPMLIAQGANDPRVKKEESEQIVSALKQHEIEHEYLLFPDEGHGFAKPENQLRFYKTAEAFLAKHLGGRLEK